MEARTLKWYHDNLLKILLVHKENRVKHIDETMELAEEFLKIYHEPAPAFIDPPVDICPPIESTDLMKPVEPEVLDLLYKSEEKGASKRYLHERYKKNPSMKYYIRDCNNWYYGWNKSRHYCTTENFGLQSMRHEFYRKSNVAPDPPDYAQAGGSSPHPCNAAYTCYFY